MRKTRVALGGSHSAGRARNRAYQSWLVKSRPVHEGRRDGGTVTDRRGHRPGPCVPVDRHLSLERHPARREVVPRRGLSLVPFATAWMGETVFAPFPTAAYGVVSLCGTAEGNSGWVPPRRPSQGRQWGSPRSYRLARGASAPMVLRTSSSVAIDVSPGVVMARAPCAAPQSIAHWIPWAVMSP